MVSKIISFFTVNIVWKVTALVLASILWVIAVNLQDPLENRRFHSVRIGFENMETLNRLGLVLLNQEDIERSPITVGIFANRRLLNQIDSVDMRAYVDLGSAIFGQLDLVGEVISAPVSLSLPDAVAANIISYAPMPPNVRLMIDRLDTREFPVSIVKMGDPLLGYISMEPTATPMFVEITGPSSILDTIMHVRTQVELNDMYEDYTTNAVLAVYNENNINITDRVTIEPASVEVFVPINMRAQVPVRMPTLAGSLPAGHVVTNIQIEPAHIDIVGRAEDLAVFAGIILEPIDVRELSIGATTIYRDARDSVLATPLSVQNARPHEIAITVTLELEATREFIIPIEDIEIIGLPAEDHSAILPENLELRLTGVERLIHDMSEYSIMASIDLTELEAGVHNVPVSLILPDGVRRADAEVSLRVVILADNNDDDTELDEDSQTPGTGDNNGGNASLLSGLLQQGIRP